MPPGLLDVGFIGSVKSSLAGILANDLRGLSASLILLGDLSTISGTNTTSLNTGVSTWLDQSINTKNAAANYTGAPSLVKDSTGVFLGLNLVSGGGMDIPISLSASSTSNYSLIGVEIPAMTGSGNYRTVTSRDIVGLFTLHRGDSNKFYSNSHIANFTSATAGTKYVWSASAPTGGNWQIHVQGTNITDASVAVNDFGRITIGQGGIDGSGEPGDTVLYALVIVPYANRLAATTKLANYYGITLNP